MKTSENESPMSIERKAKHLIMYCYLFGTLKFLIERIYKRFEKKKFEKCGIILSRTVSKNQFKGFECICKVKHKKKNHYLKYPFTCVDQNTVYYS